jgi:hypothetical protein
MIASAGGFAGWWAAPAGPELELTGFDADLVDSGG